MAHPAKPAGFPSSGDLERIAAEAYDRCHPDDSFADLKRRSAFSKEDRCLLRDWLSYAERQIADRQ
jgi:hypothetical protein